MPRHLRARTADRHALYTEAVQSPESDARFLSRHFARVTGRRLRRLREDFCGTAALSCAFVRQHREHTALGVDRDAATLAWGRRHYVGPLPQEQRRRVRLLRADVRAITRPRVELTCALNFSWFVFHTRTELEGYLRRARAGLVPGGLLVLDIFGGSDAQRELAERRRLCGFRYVWDQVEFEPVTARYRCAIHFEFPDGSRLRNAFTYDWRLWSLPEAIEAMAAAGFADVHVLWENTDRRRGRGNGVYRRVARGENDPAWLAYVVGRKL